MLILETMHFTFTAWPKITFCHCRVFHLWRHPIFVIDGRDG